MSKFFKNLVQKEWTMDDKFLFVTLGALVGMVLGFYISPVKQGITMFSGNGSHNSGNKSQTTVNKPQKEKKEK